MMVVAIVAGGVVGFINGTLLTRLHLPHPFVTTRSLMPRISGISEEIMMTHFPAFTRLFITL